MNATNSLPDRGGQATYTDELALHLQRRGASVTLLTYPASQSNAPSSHPPYEIRRYPSFDLKALIERGGKRIDLITRVPFKILAMAWDTIRTLRRHSKSKDRPVLWAINWWPEAIVAYLVSCLCKVPYTITAHGREAIISPAARRHFLYKEVMNKASRIFAVSNHTSEAIVQCGVAPDRIRVIHNGVSPEHFRLDPQKGTALVEQIRNTYVPGDGFLLLTVSRLDLRKGHFAVLDSMRGLRQRIPGLHYVAAGEGAYRTALEQKVTDLGLNEAVTFLGEVPEQDKIALLHACDLFVMPNRDMIREDGWLDTEGFGIVFVEASACGKPVIAGRAGGACEAVLHERTGILVDPSNVTELEEAIYTLWRDKDLALRLGKEGQRLAEKDFSWERLSAQYLKELESIPNS